MRIVSLDTYVLTVPLVTPFKTALRTVQQVQDLVVIIELEQGIRGFGEAAPTLVITGESLASMNYAITQLIRPLLVGQSIDNFQQLLQLLHGAMQGNSSAKAAVEIALYDARARQLGLPLNQLLGGGPTELTTDLTISVNAAETMIADAKAAVALGYRQLKLKVGTDLTQDIQRVIAVHQALPSDIVLRLDVNQGWSAKQSIYALQQIEQAGVILDLVEQPVKAQDIAGLKAVTAAVQTPVMADESAFSPQQVIRLLEDRACDIINIKLMKTGGISQAMLVAQIAALYQVPCMMGCMLESSVSVAAAAHVASAFSQGINRLDLDGPTLCQFDPAEGGTVFAHAHIRLNQSPGLGITALHNLQPAKVYLATLL